MFGEFHESVFGREKERLSVDKQSLFCYSYQLYMRKIIVFTSIFVFYLFASTPVQAFWIWSTKEKKWKNPHYSPLASPQLQMDRAMGFFQEKNYKQAFKEFRKVIIHYPDAKQAPDAQYYSARCLEGLNEMYRAYQEYQKVIDSYPYSTRIEEIVGREYAIGEHFLNRERKKWLGIALDDLFEHPSIEIFKKVAENSPYSEHGIKAQYTLGILYSTLGRFDEAIEALKTLIEKHPESTWADAAKYQLAITSSQASLKSDYDQAYTEEAKRRFKEFVAAHPDAELSKTAMEELNRLKEKDAEKNFNIGKFYEKQKNFKSALVYYGIVIERHSKTTWAEHARKAMEGLKQYEENK